MTASRSLNSPFSLPKAAISVGQTKVKSLGQKKTIFHLPSSDASLIAVKAFLGSVETTALRSKFGNLSPIVSMVSSLLGLQRVCGCLGGWLDFQGDSPQLIIVQIDNSG